ETGAEKWRKSVMAPLRSAPKVAAGKLFVVTLDNQLLVMNPADGELLWTHRGITEQAGMMSSVSPAVVGPLVLVPYSSGEIYALEIATGKEVWSHALSSGKGSLANALLSGISGDPLVDKEVVISVSSGGSVAVQGVATGQKSWERPIGSLNTPWVAGDSLFLITNTNQVVCFLKFDGKIRWVTPLPRFEDPEDKLDPITLKGPVLVDGKLAVAASDGKLYLISADTGKIASTLDVPERIMTAPVVAGGQMYFVTQDATLYSLK
ncbi:MAG: PQQ-like beta-propeller repeat protein, partial [Rickettsiales bacterium]|nr:PQQ-like beta-propeller repeat protein [Rickettsiales bacterium]